MESERKRERFNFTFIAHGTWLCLMAKEEEGLICWLRVLNAFKV